MADVVWDGVTRRATLKPEAVKVRDELADAAHAYQWDRVLDILAADPDLANVTRLDGASRYTPLHQAAHAGAPADVVDHMVRLGAWRTLQNARGERPVDVAARTDHTHLEPALQPCRHQPGDRWYVDETHVKVNGVWRYVFRAIDQHGQVIDVLLSARRDVAAARRFFHRALSTLKVKPVEVITDAAPVYPAVLDELIPSAWHRVEQYANNPIEADHGRLKHRLRPMRGLRTDRTAQVIIAGHAFTQNVRRGQYELGLDVPPALRVAAAFTELAHAI